MHVWFLSSRVLLPSLVECIFNFQCHLENKINEVGVRISMKTFLKSLLKEIPGEPRISIESGVTLKPGVCEVCLSLTMIENTQV